MKSRRFLHVFPTTRGAWLVAAAGVLWLLPGGLGRLFGAAAAVAIVIAFAADFIVLPPAAAIEIERRVRDTIGLGDENIAEYHFRSLWRWPICAQLFDAFPAGVRGGVSTPVQTIPARGEWSFTSPISGETRGKASLSGVAARVTTTFGLLVRIVRSADDGDVVVVPSIANVRRFRLLAMQHRLNDAGVRALKQRGEGNAFAGLRDYVPGDDPRLVDWKATARHQRLITREQTVERSQTVITMIDCGRAMTQHAGRFTRFEHVLSATLLLSDVASTAGDRVGMIAFDDDIRAFVPPQRGTAALRSLRTTMSALDATLVEPDYPAAFRLLATRQRRRALVVFFTDVLDARTARAFVAYAGRAAQRHAIVIVAMSNETLQETARPTADGTLALYRAAAAEELIHERADALARMRQAGLTVIDIAPTHMATAVVNRYLEIKARGLL